ncbi:MAG: molecular chaperone DnaK [Lachnospiraceae bacterium]|nr:molecular chaperone DnaK [Lachnospiraceae bacterium]
MGKVIGIDLGTTNSCVAIIENGEPTIINSSTGGRTTPSIVAFSKTGERIVGEIAARQFATNPERTIASIKRHMGTNWCKNIDGTDYKPQMISAMILMQLKKEAEDFTGENIKEAVITVPAYFNDVQRQATKDAGRIAGLNVLRIVNEPTSAALSYGLNHGESQKVMVYDLGGGTFDVSIIEIADGVIEVLATAGDNHLGGDDFDDRIVEYLVAEFKKEHGVDIKKDMTAFYRVKEAAKKAKEELSTSQTTTINLPYLIVGKNEPLHMDVTLSRIKFNELVYDLVERTKGPVMSALNDAGIAASELGKVLLVGGSTRIPLVSEKVKSITGKEPSRNINPDECVALGAAVLGDTLSGNALVTTGQGSNLLLLDVTPMSLSIETMGGVATRLIDRNTTVPARYSKVFTTAAPYQRSVLIKVLQGERPMAKDNKKIGDFKLKGIRKAMPGVPQIEVTFDIDVNGILRVSAKDLDTMKEQSITIEASDRMSDEEIQQAMRDAAEYASLDNLRRQALDVSSEASNLAGKVQQSLKNAGKDIDKAERKIIKRDLALLQKYLLKLKVDKVKQEEIDKIKQAKEVLETSSANLLAKF